MCRASWIVAAGSMTRLWARRGSDGASDSNGGSGSPTDPRGASNLACATSPQAQLRSETSDRRRRADRFRPRKLLTAPSPAPSSRAIQVLLRVFREQLRLVKSLAVGACRSQESTARKTPTVATRSLDRLRKNRAHRLQTIVADGPTHSNSDVNNGNPTLQSVVAGAMENP